MNHTNRNQSQVRTQDIRACGVIQLRPAANDCTGFVERADKPPMGYRIVEDDLYCIGPRDMVFAGGRQSSWRSARRAGESGSFRRDSAAIAIAVLAA